MIGHEVLCDLDVKLTICQCLSVRSVGTNKSAQLHLNLGKYEVDRGEVASREMLSAHNKLSGEKGDWLTSWSNPKVYLIYVSLLCS